MANGFNNPWYTQVDEITPEYIPLPMEMLFQAGQAVQQRSDAAYQAMDATQSGLSSLEAYAPAHRDYRDRISTEYRNTISDLLDKYNNKASDPQFQREMRRINNQFQSDPNLSTIAHANTLYKDRLKSIQKISEDGGRYIDSNPGFTGADEFGNLTADVGSIRRTNFEKDLADAFKESAKAKIGTGDYTSNEEALAATLSGFMAGAGTDPIMRDAYEYYMQQGLSDEQASYQIMNHLNRLATGSRSWLKDDMNDRLNISRANLGIARQKLAWDAEDRMAAMQSVLVPSLDPVENRGINEGLIRTVSGIRESLSKADNSTFLVPYTKENLEKFPEGNIRSGGSAGTGAPGQSFIEVDKTDYIRDNQSVIDEARSVVDLNNTMSDAAVLEAYENMLKADNNAPTYLNVTDPKARKALTELYGGDLRDSYYEDSKGKHKKTLDSKLDLSKVSNITYTGHTSSPINRDGTEFPNGAVRLSGIDKKTGKPITFYRPLGAGDPLTQLNPVKNNISRALGSNLGNSQLKNNPEFNIIINTAEGPASVYPQKRNLNGRIGIVYEETDASGNVINVYDPASMEELEFQNTNRYIKTLTK